MKVTQKDLGLQIKDLYIKKQDLFSFESIKSNYDKKFKEFEDQLDLTQKENTLIVKGERQSEDEKQYVYQGIAERDFERKFQLADYVKVVGASMENGLLHIDLEREIPEAMQPRKIAINGKQLIEG